MAASVNLEVDQYAAFTLTITFTDSQGNAVHFTGWVFKFMVQPATGGTPIDLSSTLTVGTPDTNLLMNIPGTTTGTFQPPTNVNLTITGPSGPVYQAFSGALVLGTFDILTFPTPGVAGPRLMEGIFLVRPGVSH
jgi:hypothetical protein